MGRTRHLGVEAPVVKLGWTLAMTALVRTDTRPITLYALVFNIIVLAPVVFVLMLGLPAADQWFGPLTEGWLWVSPKRWKALRRPSPQTNRKAGDLCPSSNDLAQAV